MKYNPNDVVVMIGDVEIKGYSTATIVGPKPAMNEVVVRLHVEVDLEKAVTDLIDNMTAKGEMFVAMRLKWARACLYQENPGGSYE